MGRHPECSRVNGCRPPVPVEHHSLAACERRHNYAIDLVNVRRHVKKLRAHWYPARVRRRLQGCDAVRKHDVRAFPQRDRATRRTPLRSRCIADVRPALMLRTFSRLHRDLQRRRACSDRRLPFPAVMADAISRVDIVSLRCTYGAAPARAGLGVDVPPAHRRFSERVPDGGS